MATRLARAKVTESVIALILGHKRNTMTSRYINPHWDEMVEAIAVMSDLCHRFVTGDENGQAEEADNDKINNIMGHTLTA